MANFKVLNCQRNFLLSIASASLLTLAVSSPCAADLAFKKKIIENCEQAKQQLGSLERSQQIASVQDLRLILNLSFSQIDSLSPESAPNAHKIGGFHPPLDDFKETEMWRVFQPSREVKAKRCALEIIKQMSPYSIEALPELIKLTQDHTLPSDVQNLLYDSMYAVLVDTAHDESFHVPDQVIEQLVEMLEGGSNFYASNALIELHKFSIAILIKALERPDSVMRDNITATLLKIDSQGGLIGQGILKLLASADDGLRQRALVLLSSLPAFYPFSVPAFIERLSDLSPEVENAAVQALHTAFSATRKMPAITISKEALERLINKFKTSQPETRKALLPALLNLGPLTAGFQSGLLTILDNSNDQLRAEVLAILGSLKLEQQSTNALFKALTDKSNEVRIEAIRAIGKQTYSKDISAAFSKTLKANASERNPQVKQEIIIEIAKAVAKIKPASAASTFIPYFAGVLQVRDKASGTDITYPAAEALIEIGAEALPSAIKAMGSSDPQVRHAAIKILGEIEPITKQAATSIVQALKDQDTQVQAAAEKYTLKIGPNAAATLNLMLKSSNVSHKLIAARLLLQLGVKSVSTINVITETIKKEPCNDSLKLILSLPTSAGISHEVISEKAMLCLANGNSEALTALALIAPLQPAAQTRLLEVLNQNQLDKKLRLDIFEKSEKLGLPNNQIVELLIKELQEEDKTLKFKAVSLLGKLGAEALPATESLITFVRDNSGDNLLANEAVISLVQINPQSYDYAEFFLNKLDSDDYQWAEKSLMKIDAVRALPVLERAMNELPAAEKLRAITICGNLGPISANLAPQIAEFIKQPDPQVSYVATVALLKVSPNHPEAIKALKRILLRESGQKLLNENFNVNLLPVLKTIEEGSASLVERNLLKELENKINVQ